MDRYQLLPALTINTGRAVKLRTHFKRGVGFVFGEVIASNLTDYWHVASIVDGTATYTQRPVAVGFVAAQVAALDIPDTSSWSVEPTERCEKNPWCATRVAPKPAVRDVYFIQATMGGPIKIGCSESPDDRLVQLQVGSPFKLRIIGIIPEGGRQLEAELHRRFGNIRSHGEWFSPNSELADYITPWRT